MNKLILSLSLLWLLGFSTNVFGQTEEVENGYWLNEGRVMHLRNGQLLLLKEGVLLPNGLTLLTNGTLVTREGVRRSLQEGQAIDSSGRILFPQTQRNGSVVLVPRRAYILERDPGMMRSKKAGPPSNKAQGYYRSRFK
jgi:hypothetical protein